ncbi:hypothetical protein EX30DRAFT_396458 [Ascodesmis nigricans]|uniref:Uncharacterized protein n=1 Tax=Ascodesmis nigricans TaxID=341454 RepID=A0A4S2MUG4_9PEZI|nr:hypothetical protein EX30DRAFT_396458 [Ascodesmis nigricans]
MPPLLTTTHPTRLPPSPTPPPSCPLLPTTHFTPTTSTLHHFLCASCHHYTLLPTFPLRLYYRINILCGHCHHKPEFSPSGPSGEPGGDRLLWFELMRACWACGELGRPWWEKCAKCGYRLVGCEGVWEWVRRGEVGFRVRGLWGEEVVLVKLPLRGGRK